MRKFKSYLVLFGMFVVLPLVVVYLYAPHPKPVSLRARLPIAVLSPLNGVPVAVITENVCTPTMHLTRWQAYRIVYLPNVNDDPCNPKTWTTPASQSQLVEGSTHEEG